MKNSSISKVEKGTAKSFKFDYDLAGLPDYEQYGSEMLIKAFLGLTLPKYASVRPNLRGTTELIGFTETDVILQDLSCGFSPTGDTIQNVVEVSLCNKKANVEFCPYDLYNTYLSQYLSNGNFQEEIPFAEAILEDVSNRTANQIELQLWRNTTSTGGTIYNSQCFNGVIATITSGAGATDITYTACTPTNGLEVLTTVYQSIPENVLHRDDLVIYVSFSDYRAFIASMRNNSFINLFDFNDADAASGMDWGVMLPATNVRVVPTQGLNGQSKIYGGPARYMFVGMNSELQTTKLMYDPFQDVVKLNLHTSYGYGCFDPASFVVAN
jgi:hypothetical protein